MKIDADKFLFMYESSEFKPLADNAESGLRSLLGFFEVDEHMTDLRWVGYGLATTYHECAGRWQPIAEFDKGKGRKYGSPDPVTGHVYYGRGYVQLTWADNYKAMGKVVGVDLYQDPDAAMIPEVAYKIMSYGMRNGSFTGVGLQRYFNSERTDPVSARKIINGMDKAELIAGYYDKFMRILEECATEG
jgi:predicted chitinase